MNSTTTTIGRNIGDTPMLPTAWEDFREEVRAAITAAGHVIVADADYVGAWDGVTEDAHVFVSLGDAEIGDVLAPIGREFHQDAIGVSTGEARLV